MEHSEPAPTEESTTLANALVDALDAVLSCSRSVVELAVATFIAGGHLLLEDVPGTGKTLMANSIWVDTQPVMGKELTLQESINQCADKAISRTDAISIMWRVLGEWKANEIIPGVDAAREKLQAAGVSLNVMEWDTVPVCYAAGLVSGDENGNLNLNGTLTRAEGCVMLCNLVDYASSHGISMGRKGA